MFKEFGKKHPVLKALGIILMYPAVQIYGTIFDYPKQIKKITEDLDAWERHKENNAHKESDSHVENITQIFNECAGQIKDYQITLVCHNNSDLTAETHEGHKADFQSLFSNTAQIGPTQEKGRYALSINTDFIKLYDDEDIRFILGHELSHLKNGDFEKQKQNLKLTNAFNLALIAGAASLAAGVTPLVFAGSLAARIAYGIGNSMRTQKTEYEADKTAVTDFNVSAQAAQFTLVKIDPYNYMTRHEKKTGLQKFIERIGSHPPIYKRVEVLEPLAMQERKKRSQGPS